MGYEADILILYRLSGILYRLSGSRLTRNLMQEIEVRLRSRGLTMLHVMTVQWTVAPTNRWC